MLWYATGAADAELHDEDLKKGLFTALDALGARRNVLAVPPDLSRLHSRAGILTRHCLEYYGDRLTDVLPAIGTHAPMTGDEIAEMYPGVPADRFRTHDWRGGTATLGEVPAEYVREVSEGAVAYPWPAQVDRLLLEGGHDLIVSIGQVVPHEVVGMANHNKNIFVGTGGPEGINKSHFLGAAYGMERMMGRADTPVRRVLNYASEHFGAALPVLYVLTVVGRGSGGELVTRGLYIGDGTDCFEKAAALSLQVNFEMLEQPLENVVVYLDPAEFKSTWLGNKSIYRTRMAIADGGTLTVLAPGVKTFGEDAEIDRLIRKYGYRGTPRTMAAVDANAELQDNLSAAAHLIHGSSEDRFSIVYCPGGLSRAETEGVGFGYGELDAARRRYDPARLRDGMNTLPDGEEVFFISNPAIGLWACRDRFEG